jgi:hypothetical protein
MAFKVVAVEAAAMTEEAVMVVVMTSLLLILIFFNIRHGNNWYDKPESI